MRITAITFLSLLAVVTHARVEAANLSDAELKALPAFCEARMKRTPQFDQWSKTLGPDFLHTHHYCSGLGLINRYYASRTPQKKLYNLQGANGALTYMVQHASPSYSLMPDVYLNRGLVFSLMGKKGEALADLRKARELNPKLVKAYTLAADIQAKLNRKDEALALVTEGMRHVPDSKVLQRAYKERGGKLPYPEPLAATAVPQAEQAGAAAAAAGIPAQAPPVPVPAAQDTAVRDSVSAKESAAEVVPETPKIGSPTNPWCRFCPDPAQ